MSGTSELRQRAVAPKPGTTDSEPPASVPQPTSRPPHRKHWLPVVVATLGFLIFVGGATYIITGEKIYKDIDSGPIAPRIFTLEELSQYTGKGGGRIYLACMGKVFDVTSGKKHYAHDSGYGIFSGRDASKSYVTGDFENDLNDNVGGFSAEEHAGLLHWREFYEQHQEYKFAGKVVGRFYDKNGNPTALLKRAEKLAAEFRAEEAAREAENAESSQLLCNVSWRKDTGGIVYCSDDRVPRRVATPHEEDGTVTEKCVCFEEKDVNEGRRLYEGCDADSSSCQTSPPEA